ncbi:hypothetical protein AVEN_200938-1 [Araneus ventricosus]|uniref:Uncharacterized protein n=1 Tax=Araneus ventricosus TaxID=182803 RepID=A0A4Y2LSU4_ARAVE|nr:hypothetical protein AVEN_200938-1 [Araneus ventricosus]
MKRNIVLSRRSHFTNMRTFDTQQHETGIRIKYIPFGSLKELSLERRSSDTEDKTLKTIHHDFFSQYANLKLWLLVCSSHICCWF